MSYFSFLIKMYDIPQPCTISSVHIRFITVSSHSSSEHLFTHILADQLIRAVDEHVVCLGVLPPLLVAGRHLNLQPDKEGLQS